MAVGGAIDTAALKARVDLGDVVSRDVRLKKVASTRGGEFAGPCPFCGGRDRFRVQPSKGLWFCRQCSPDGRWQDAIAFVMKRDGVPFAEACRILGASPSELGEGVASKRVASAPVFAEDVEPSDIWRARASAFVEACEAVLWSTAATRARAYLAARGLREETLRLWRVGFHDADRREPAGQWGLPDFDEEGRTATVWLPRGIVLPWLTGVTAWQLKIRRATDDPKYWSIQGGHPLLYGADTLVPGQPAVMCEGEIDTLLLWQAAYDRTAVVSLGSASRRPTRRAALLLAQAVPLLIAYDADDEGERGSERLQQLAPRVHRIRPPAGKDVGEFVESGGRPKAWIAYELKRVLRGPE